MVLLRFTAKFDPFLSLDCTVQPVAIQVKEGIKFAIRQHCFSSSTVPDLPPAPCRTTCWTLPSRRPSTASSRAASSRRRCRTRHSSTCPGRGGTVHHFCELLIHRDLIGGHPFKTSALEGGGGPRKADGVREPCKAGCVKMRIRGLQKIVE